MALSKTDTVDLRAIPHSSAGHLKACLGWRFWGHLSELWSVFTSVTSSDEHIVWWYIVIPNIVSFSKYRINIVIAFFLDNITRYCMHVILVYFSLSWTCESKMTFKISYGLTYNSMNWSNLCICYTFEEWNFVYCTVFSRISRKCRNFCDLRAYFTKWEYRVISCDYRIKTQNIV